MKQSRNSGLSHDPKIQSKTKIKPKERHSELAVNLAGSMAMFLYKTYMEEKNVS